MSDVHVLYRFYSATGQLLYVGITNSPPERFRSHEGSKEWWAQVSGITVENYETRDELCNAERRAIQVERPLHNVVHNGSRKLHRIPRPESVSPIAARLEYRCERCKKPVAAGKGYLHVSYDDIYKTEQVWKSFCNKRHIENEGEEPIGGWSAYRVIRASEMPDLSPARWRIHHRACDADPEGNDYWVDVERISSHEKLLSWTAHLIQKGWLIHTDWSSFLYSMISVEARAS